MFGLATSTALQQLREAFGALERRLERLEERGPALSATLLDAQDKLHRASARWERAMGRARSTASEDPDERETDELWQEVHR